MDLKTTAYLDEIGKKIYCHWIRQDKPYNAVISVFPEHTSVNETTNELTVAGLNPIYVEAMKFRRDGRKLPLFLVDINAWSLGGNHRAQERIKPKDGKTTYPRNYRWFSRISKPITRTVYTVPGTSYAAKPLPKTPKRTKTRIYKRPFRN